MRIGELAEQAGISTKAIRYYEQVGILTPPARTPSGYRSYDPSALGRLGFVRAAQAVGLTLGEIRQIIAFRDNDRHPAPTSPTCSSAVPPSSTPASPGSSSCVVSCGSWPSGLPPWIRSEARPSGSATSSASTRTRLLKAPQTLEFRRQSDQAATLGLGPLVGPADDLPQEWPLGVGVGRRSSR